MALSSSRLVRLVGWTLTGAGFVVAGATGAREYLDHRKQAAEQDARAFKHGLESDEQLARALPRTKTVRIWAAGFRSSSGAFCPPCSMFPPPTVLYETSDPAEIRELGTILRYQRIHSGAEVANCGPLTFDFVHGEEILHSFNYKGSRLSEESGPAVRAWLEKRGLWTKLNAAREASAKSASKPLGYTPDIRETPMEPSPAPRKRPPVFWIALVVLGTGGVGALWAQRHVESRRNADRVQGILDESVAGATGLRVWGAGARTPSGFCGCAVVPKPERIFYETRDSDEIRQFGALLRARPHLEPDPQCKCCGSVTIDFLRGDEILLSIHPKGATLRSTRGLLSITPESSGLLEQWLTKRSVRENLLQAQRLR